MKPIQIASVLLTTSFALAQSEDRDAALIDAYRAERRAYDELRARISEYRGRMTDGPCRCGAPTHDDCETKSVCEPAEKREGELLADEWRRSKARIAGLKRCAVISREIRELSSLRSRLQLELKEVEAGDRAGIEARMQMGWKGFLELASAVVGEALEALPDGPKKDACQGLYRAVNDAIDAIGTDDEVARMRAVTGAMLGLQKAVKAGLDGISDEARAWLRIVAKVVDLGVEVVATMADAREGHGAILAHGSALMEKGADLVEEIPQLKLGTKVFKSSYSFASFTLVGWHLWQEVEQKGLARELRQRAQLTLLQKINQLGARIVVAERELAACLEQHSRPR